jgi:hypothetical protein
VPSAGLASTTPGRRLPNPLLTQLWKPRLLQLPGDSLARPLAHPRPTPANPYLSAGLDLSLPLGQHSVLGVQQASVNGTGFSDFRGVTGAHTQQKVQLFNKDVPPPALE